MATTTRVIQIGNSRGIRVPKAVLEQAELPEQVELRAEPGRLVVTAARKPGELLRVREIMKTRASCARQGRIYADCGSFTQVVDSVVSELRDSVPVVAGR